MSAATLTYDEHGNTTRLADQVLGYDVADRHMSTALDDGTLIVYQRDTAGRIVSRTATSPSGAAESIRYTYAGGGLHGVLSSAGDVIERSVSLPGGVTVTLAAAGGESWSYPNLHGDSIIRTDQAGVRIGVRADYDPFGQPIDPVSGDIGTTVADDAVTDTSPGEADYSWVGGHQKIYEHQGSIATIEMGARQYVAALGRFLSVDLVEGGVSNSYDYPADPINMLDLTGMMSADSYVTMRKYGQKSKWEPSSTYERSPLTSARLGNSRKSLPRPPSLGRPTGGKPIPYCDSGKCEQTDVTIQFCAVVCAFVGHSIREDGRHFGSGGFGLGIESDLSLNVGRSVGKSAGLAVGASCSAAIGGGFYAEGGMGIDIGSWNGTSTFTSYKGTGGVIGSGAGCNATIGGSWAY